MSPDYSRKSPKLKILLNSKKTKEPEKKKKERQFREQQNKFFKYTLSEKEKQNSVTDNKKWLSEIKIKLNFKIEGKMVTM